MSYTVGIKRRFLPGFKAYKVKSHDWQNFRFVLELEEGGELHIPGFQAPSLKVYPDFWTHLHNLRAQIPQRAPAPQPIQQVPQQQQQYQAPLPQYQTTEPSQQIAQWQTTQPAPGSSDFERKALELAAQRVNSILASNGPQAQGGFGSQLS